MQREVAVIWGRMSKEIRKRVRPQQFNTWFKKVELSENTEDNIILKVPSGFWLDWLKSHYLSSIEESARIAMGRDVEVGFIVDPLLGEKNLADSDAARTQSVEGSDSRERFGEQLNKRYTFENFVVGPSNQFAHAAAMAVAESPSKAYNPLFIYGGVGLGKTHLIQAVCHSCLARRVRTRVIYVPCEAFLNDYVSAVQNRSLDNFRKKYRQAELLIIDDIHFLANKERSQEEFFHTFNTLYNADKQIILSSDSAPKTIPAIEERMSSRFRWGLVAKIDAPVYETRAAIVRKKAEMYGGGIPDDVVEYLAGAVENNIRELEGSVIRVIGFASLTGRKIDVDLAVEIQEERPGRRKTVTMQEIMDAVTDVFGVKTTDLQSKSRTRSLVRPRQVCMYLARKLTGHSLEEIGRHLGGRDHSTVVYAQEKVEAEKERDRGFRRTVEEIRSRLEGSQGY